MKPVEKAELLAADVNSSSPSNSWQQQKTGPPLNASENSVDLPQNAGERVVYISQSTLHSGTRVQNMIQGRAFHVVNDVPEERVQLQNKVPEQVVFVKHKTPEAEIKNPKDHYGPETPVNTNITVEPKAYVQNNIPEGNISMQDTLSENVTQCPNIMQERVVYMPQTPHTQEGNVHIPDTRMITNDGNQVRVVYVPHDAVGDCMNMPSNTVNVTTNDPNQMPVRVVYMPHNVDDNVTMANNTVNVTTNEPNQMPVRVVYIPHNVNDNVTMANNTVNVTTNDPSQMPTRVVYVPRDGVGDNLIMLNTSMNVTNNPTQMPVHIVYVPHNIPGSNHNMQNCLPGVTIQRNMPGENLYPPSNPRSRTPSPSRQDHSGQLAQQLMNMTCKMLKQGKEIKSFPENVVHTTQPIAEPVMYSPHMMGNGSAFSPQMQQSVGYMGPIQYQTPYISQGQAYMPVMNQPHYIPPSIQPVQDDLYTSTSFGTAESLISQDLPQPLESSVPNFGSEFPDINTDNVDDDCCSWLECCCCLFSSTEE